MVLSINEQYMYEKISFELELSDFCLNLSMTEKLFSIEESENIFKRFIGWLKKIITNLINTIKSVLRNKTNKLKSTVQSVSKASEKVQEKVKQEKKQYVEFDDDVMDREYSMIGTDYMELILNSFLLSKTGTYDKLTTYLNWFKDPEMNQYYIQNEVAQFCSNFNTNGFNYIYPKLDIQEYIKTPDGLKKFIKTDIDDNSDYYIIEDGKMDIMLFMELDNSVKFFEKALNIMIKETDIAQKNLSMYKNSLDKIQFVSVTEVIFNIFKTFSDNIINIVQSNIAACEVLNEEIKFRLESMKNLISHVKKS